MKAPVPGRRISRREIAQSQHDFDGQEHLSILAKECQILALGFNVQNLNCGRFQYSALLLDLLEQFTHVLAIDFTRQEGVTGKLLEAARKKLRTVLVQPFKKMIR